MNDYSRILTDIFGGRKWICVGAVVMEAAGSATTLRDLGGEVLALGASRGAGEIPEWLQTINLDVGSARSMMESMRRAEAAIAELPAWARAEIDRFDPQGTARAVLPIFGSLQRVADRPVFGARDPAWVALEDKTRADALWDAAGVVRAPSRIVKPMAAELAAAWDLLDDGFGLVAALDNAEGWHGGAEGTRWIRTRDGIAGVVEELAGRAERLRVMPFLEGLPCSIHGWVVNGTVIAFRPVEMVVLRKSGTPRFHYAQAASFWDAPAALHDEMRGVARAVGAHLRDAFGYRGAFTVDGVATTQGFRPTELNPRFGAALSILTRAIPDFPAYALNVATVEQDLPELDPARLEADVLDASRRHRAGGGMAITTRVLPEQNVELDFADGAWALSDRDTGDGHARIGHHPVGSIVLFRLNEATTHVGPPVGGRVASALGFLNDVFDLALGRLEPAPASR
jgi:hypothetical protein